MVDDNWREEVDRRLKMLEDVVTELACRTRNHDVVEIQKCPAGLHEWIDPMNKVVEANGYLLCKKCGLLKPPGVSV